MLYENKGKQLELIRYMLKGMYLMLTTYFTPLLFILTNESYSIFTMKRVFH